MTSFEEEIQTHIATIKAEVEAQAWHVENEVRRHSFLTRRMAAMALVDVDPYVDEAFEEMYAA